MPGFFQELVGGVLPSGTELHICRAVEKERLSNEKGSSSSIVHQERFGMLKEDMWHTYYFVYEHQMSWFIRAHVPFHD